MERFIKVGVFEVKEDAKTHIFDKYDLYQYENICLNKLRNNFSSTG